MKGGGKKKHDFHPAGIRAADFFFFFLLMPQHDLYFYICFTYDYVITYFQSAITIRLHYGVRCNPKVIQIQLTANDIHEVRARPRLLCQSPRTYC